jgi:hypothetical protein
LGNTLGDFFSQTFLVTQAHWTLSVSEFACSGKEEFSVDFSA